MSEDDDFVEFVSARWSSLYRLAWLLTGSDHAAQDVLQASLEKTYVRWPRVRQMAAPEAWLRRVMVNEVASSHRRPWARREWSRETVPELPGDSFEGSVADHAVLWPLVCALPDRQRAVIVLRYYEDLTDQQTAELLGCAVGTVKSQAHDAVAALRRGVAATREHGTVVGL
jgi:RNA polymerase sigma-70 factor (sigma-E family)